MDKDKVTRIPSSKREINVTVKITKHLSGWLKQEHISPTATFVEACKELGYKNNIVLKRKENKWS